MFNDWVIYAYLASFLHSESTVLILWEKKTVQRNQTCLMLLVPFIRFEDMMHGYPTPYYVVLSDPKLFIFYLHCQTAAKVPGTSVRFGTGLKSRAGMPSSLGRIGTAAGQDGTSRPMTAVRAAGYTSAGAARGELFLHIWLYVHNREAINVRKSFNLLCFLQIHTS